MSRRSTWLGLASAVGFALIAYVFGAFSARFQVPPYPQVLEFAFDAVEARVGSWFRTEVSADFGDRKKRWKNLEGVVQHEKGAPKGKYTLFSSTRGTRAYLIDMEGNVVHKWKAQFHRVWDETPHIDEPVGEGKIYWRRVEMMPNGDLVACYAGVSDTPYGYGLVRIDRNSEVVWKFSGRTHHDFDVTDDGGVVALEHEYWDAKSKPVEGFPQYDRKMLVDWLVEVSPEGELERRVSIIEAMQDSEFSAALDLYPGETINDPEEELWDPFHCNNVDIVPDEFGRRHDYAEPGQILISCRTNDLVGLVDLDRKEMTWGTRGFWNMQHDPDFRDNGRLMVFDNEGHEGPGGSSRVLEYNPKTGGASWVYHGTREKPFHTNESGSLQPLPDGHVLVTSSNQKRMFELDRDGEIVWEFFSRDDKPNVHSGVRYSADEVAFLDD